MICDAGLLRGRSVGGIETGTISMSGPELLESSRRAADKLSAAAIGSRSRVATDPSADAFTRVRSMLGADLLGAATLITDASWTQREYGAVLDDARPNTVIDGSSSPPEPTGYGENRVRDDEPDLFYLPTTSGSTGRPRVLCRTRRSWLNSFRAFDIELGEHRLSVGDRLLVPGQLSSSLFAFATMHGLHSGADVRLLERWSAEQAAELSRTCTAVHLVPPMLSALVAVWQRRPDLLSQCALRTVIVGGARVDDALRQRMAAVLPGCELFEYYGSAEYSMVALRRGCGPLRPVTGVDIEVRDTEGAHELHRGEPGQLWARSDQLYSGEIKAGRVHHPEAEFAHVGDRAVHHADGSLTVLGRSSATITSGAIVIAAEEVEEALRGTPGVVDVVVCGSAHARFGSIVTAVVEIDSVSPPRLDALRIRARETLAPGKRPRRWLTTAALPRNATGKAARATVSQRLDDGTLEAEALA